MPSNPSAAINPAWRFSTAFLPLSRGMASGARHIAEIAQRPKVSATGGMSSRTARPSTQLPDQISMHRVSSR